MADTATPAVGCRPLLSRTLPAGIPPAWGDEARASIVFCCGDVEQEMMKHIRETHECVSVLFAEIPWRLLITFSLPGDAGSEESG